MKSFTAVLAVLLFAGAFLCADASAHGGVVVQRVRQPFFRPRVSVVRQFVAPQAFVAPIVLQPAFRQQVFFPQAFVQPRVFVQPQAVFQQSYGGAQVIIPGGSAAFFAY